MDIWQVVSTHYYFSKPQRGKEIKDLFFHYYFTSWYFDLLCNIQWPICTSYWSHKEDVKDTKGRRKRPTLVNKNKTIHQVSLVTNKKNMLCLIVVSLKSKPKKGKKIIKIWSAHSGNFVALYFWLVLWCNIIAHFAGSHDLNW